MYRRLLGFIAGVVVPVAWPLAAEVGCPERPACQGCGCKGGPGYRAPDGHCVGFSEPIEVCGNPPAILCIFENAPGTGANRECALAKPAAKKR